MSDEAGGNDRSERMRQRRSQRHNPSESTETSNTSESSELSERSKQSGAESDSTVKEERVGTYMYLHESQKKEADRLYNVLKAEYEYEYEDEFEKNRHFYPLLVQFGLDGLDSLDASEIQDRLDSIKD